jgi:hypothetical protein
MGREQAEIERSRGNPAAADMIECLCVEVDRLEDELKPPPRSWEGVWGMFDSQKRQKNQGVTDGEHRAEG